MKKEEKIIKNDEKSQLYLIEKIHFSNGKEVKKENFSIFEGKLPEVLSLIHILDEISNKNNIDDCKFTFSRMDRIVVDSKNGNYRYFLDEFDTQGILNYIGETKIC